MSAFKNGPVPFHTMGNAAVDDIYKARPHAFCVFTRNKNGNVVVLENTTEMKGNRMVIDTYFLDLEPKYKEASRKAGRIHDRDELSWIAWMNAYGFDQEISQHGVDPVYTIRFFQVKDKPVTVKRVKNKTHGYIMINHTVCRLHHIYVHDKANMVGLPYVEYLDICGMNSKKEIVCERIFR